MNTNWLLALAMASTLAGAGACRQAGSAQDNDASASGTAPTVAKLQQFDDSVEALLGALSHATDSLKARVESREAQLDALAESSPASLQRLGNFVAEFKTMQVTLRAKDDTIRLLRRRIVALVAENRKLRDELASVRGITDELKGRIALADSTAARTDSILKRTEAVRDSAVKKATTAYVLIAGRDELERLGIAGKTNMFGLGRTVLKSVEPSRLQAVDITQSAEFQIQAPVKAVELLSSHPARSYEIVAGTTGSLLRVLDVDEFWSATKVLIVMIKS